MSRLLSLAREHKLLTALIAGTLSADAAYYALHNLAQPFRAYRISCTKQGSTEMLDAPADLVSLLHTAGQRLGLDRSRIDQLQVFICRHIDPVHLGRLSSSSSSSAARLRGFLGLPQHYGYSSADSEQRHSFFFDERALSLNTKKGRQLYRDCLLLGEEEKLFVLARELAYLNSYAAHAPPVIGSLASAGLASTAYWLTHGKGQGFVQTLLQSKQNRQNLLLSVLVGSAGCLWYVMAYQWYAAYFKSLDARVDRRASAAFPAGAVTFYQKQVKRNTLLRAMLGDSIGKKYFTVKGNEVKNWVLSDPFLPVNQRWSKLRYDQTLAARQSPAAAT